MSTVDGAVGGTPESGHIGGCSARRPAELAVDHGGSSVRDALSGQDRKRGCSPQSRVGGRQRGRGPDKKKKASQADRDDRLAHDPHPPKTVNQRNTIAGRSLTRKSLVEVY